MNCQEVQALVEEAIENRLSASCRRKVNLHLSRCAECRAFLAAEQTEHAAWFRALNDVSDIPPPTTPTAALAARLAGTSADFIGVCKLDCNIVALFTFFRHVYAYRNNIAWRLNADFDMNHVRFKSHRNQQDFSQRKAFGQLTLSASMSVMF